MQAGVLSLGRPTRTRIAVAVIGIALALLSSGVVHAAQQGEVAPPPLLLPVVAAADAAEKRRQDQTVARATRTPGVVRSRLVRLNHELLTRLAGDATPAGNRMRLELFPDTAVTVRLEGVETDPLGFTVHRGGIEGDPLGTFDLVLRDGVVAGSVDSGRRFFRLTHVEGDVVAVVEIDRSVFPNELQPIVPPVTGARPIARDGAGAAPRFNVLIVYTTAARNAAGGTPQIQAQARLAVSQMNTAFANAAQAVRAEMTGIAEVSYTETGDASTDLNWLRQDPGVAKLRSAWRADDVSLFVQNMNGGCGLGYVMQSVSTGFAPYAFNVVQRNCATDNYSYAHEVGHNIGCAHDRANAGVPGAYSYSYGYQAPDRAFRTTLAYNCSGDCPRVLYYSNPAVSLGGQPTGIDPSATNSADNALTIANTTPTVAQFFTTLPTNTFGTYDVNSGKGFAGLDPGYGDQPRFQVDVNADGRADYCRVVGNSPNLFLSCAFAGSSGFGNYNLNSGAGAANFDLGHSASPRLMADVNADNRADYCRFVGNPPNTFLSCAFATATGFGNYDLNSGRGLANFDPGHDSMPTYLVDVNADDRADYCRFVGNAPDIFLSCAFATATGFGNYDLNSGRGMANFDLGYDNMPRLMADVNADNRADYCRFVGNQPNVFFSCALAGAGGFGNFDVNSANRFDAGYRQYPAALVDVNADNRADYCRYVGDPPYVFLSCALATATNSFGAYDVSSPIGYDQGYSTSLQAMADVNADGKGDYCRFVGNQGAIFLSCGLAQVSP